MPIFKLATLAIESLSRPVAQRVNVHLKENAKFTQCVTKMGYGYQKLASKISIEPKIISKDRAIYLGSELAVELMLFGLFGSLLVYNRYRVKGDKKSFDFIEKIEDLNDRMTRVTLE
jgi:hypothetical protein